MKKKKKHPRKKKEGEAFEMLYWKQWNGCPAEEMAEAGQVLVCLSSVSCMQNLLKENLSRAQGVWVHWCYQVSVWLAGASGQASHTLMAWESIWR